jgi:hypothetical protein
VSDKSHIERVKEITGANDEEAARLVQIATDGAAIAGITSAEAFEQLLQHIESQKVFRKRALAGFMAPRKRQGAMHPRGQPQIKKSDDRLLLMTAIEERADAGCGICNAPLLRHWTHCPECGGAIDWTNERASDGG